MLILMKNNDCLFSDIQTLCNAVSDKLIKKKKSIIQLKPTRQYPVPVVTSWVITAEPINTYEVLSRVLPNCSAYTSPLESAIAGYQFQEKIVWTDYLYQKFYSAQTALSTHKSITLPRADDQIWTGTDRSVTRQGIGALMYVSRENKLLLAGFFSAKLRKHQVTWLPCEIKSLSLAAAIKHISPYIIQSTHNTCLLMDSKSCVQAFEKLCRGEFSAIPV